MNVFYLIVIQPIEYFIEFTFEFMSKRFGNTGIAIVAVSLAVSFLVLPLYKAADSIQEKELKKQQGMQPWIDHIGRSFKGDEKIMLLNTYYREQQYQKIYALRSIVPLLIQVPFFIAAFHFLSSRAGLAGDSLLILKDLGKPDGLIALWDISINLLPVIMTAVNIVSGMLYLKGHPFKDHLQHYALALFFLVVLYNSPSGLVLYWTLNNVFSLCKNILMKHSKKPKMWLYIILTVIGAASFVLQLLNGRINRLTDLVYALIILFICLSPIIISLLSKGIHTADNHIKIIKKDLFAFSFAKSETLLIQFLLTLLLGAVIPLSVVSSSPTEFIDMSSFQNPLHYVLYNMLTTLGMFIFWITVFIIFTKETYRKWFSLILLFLADISLINYMFFGRNLGTLSSQLSFDGDFHYTPIQMLLNLTVLIGSLIILCILLRYFKKILNIALLASVIALTLLGLKDVVRINTVLANKDFLEEQDQAYGFTIPLSKNGKNIIVFSLDRAISGYIPYIFHENPDLKEQFAGFTYYPNTFSFGPGTTSAARAEFGGYEYNALSAAALDTPYDYDQNDEALLVLPRIFSENGYRTIVTDPPFAGGDIDPDLSIYEPYPQIEAYNIKGHFDITIIGARERLIHHFYFYSIFKCLPLCLQHELYDGGNYYRAGDDSAFTAQDFIQSYSILKNLISFSEISSDSNDNFIMINNDTTHDTAELQLPMYEPAEQIDNTGLESGIRYDDDGNSIRVDDNVFHYHGNMAALLRIGEFLDYLRENDIYDNTRIIIVSDHGTALGQFPDLIIHDKDKTYDMQYYNPLLMVKDFNSKEFTTSDRFMSNADMPRLVTQDVIQNPVNPFTGTDISKTDAYSLPFQTITDHEGTWFTIHDDVHNPENWAVIPDPINN